MNKQILEHYQQISTRLMKMEEVLFPDGSINSSPPGGSNNHHRGLRTDHEGGIDHLFDYGQVVSGGDSNGQRSSPMRNHALA